MRDDYIRDALKVIEDPNVLINLVSQRVKQLKNGFRPMVEMFENLRPEDIALKEIINHKLSYYFKDQLTEEAAPAYPGEANAEE